MAEEESKGERMRARARARARGGGGGAHQWQLVLLVGTQHHLLRRRANFCGRDLRMALRSRHLPQRGLIASNSVYSPLPRRLLCQLLPRHLRNPETKSVRPKLRSHPRRGSRLILVLPILMHNAVQCFKHAFRLRARRRWFQVELIDTGQQGRSFHTSN